MAETNNSAAAMAAASSPIKVETISIPGYGAQSQAEFDPTKYRVRYIKVDFDSPEALADLELLETDGLTGVDIVILNKNTFTFMDKYIMVVTYLEKIGDVS